MVLWFAIIRHNFHKIIGLPSPRYFRVFLVFCSLTILIGTVPTTFVRAMTFNDLQSIIDGTPYYDPNADCIGSDNSDTGDVSLTGKNNREKIWCYLITKGKLSKGGAAGVMGNIARESWYTPNKWQIGTCADKSSDLCGYGLLQWSWGEIKQGLWKFAGETFPDTSGKVGTLKTQLDYLLHSIQTDTDADVGNKLIELLRNPDTTPEDAAWQVLNLYNCRPQYCGGATVICEQCPINQDVAVPEAKKNYKEFKDLNCGNAASATPTNASNCQCNESSSGNVKPKILIGPGHTGKSTGGSADNYVMNGDPPILDNIYGFNPELQDDWDVAQKVKKELDSKGYEVLMTKNSVSDSPTSWDRAQQANESKVDLAFEIHTDSSNGRRFSSWGETWAQFEGAHRHAGINGTGQEVELVANKDVIKKSKEYATKFTEARIAAGEKSVETFAEKDHYNPTPVKYMTSGGDIPLVMLWSKVPWIYLEAGSPTGGLTPDQKETYAKGIIDGVIASIPASGSDCTGSGDAAAIVDWALKLAWDDKGQHDIMTPRPLYKEWHDKPDFYGWYKDYSPCNQFVGVVMHASGADNKFEKSVTDLQEAYIRKHPEKYEERKNLTSTKQLEPGDLMYRNTDKNFEDNVWGEGHTWIYVGDQPGGNIREAEMGSNGHPPEADTIANGDWFMGLATSAYGLK
ncbi:MAG: phage tail tip lysozyme [Candidatus Saccharibacteria bacterium]